MEANAEIQCRESGMINSGSGSNSDLDAGKSSGSNINCFKHVRKLKKSLRSKKINKKNQPTAVT